MIDFKLSREELAGEICRAINESCPDFSLSNELIFEAINELTESEQFIFPAKEFAISNNLNGEQFLNKLFLTLGIEFEKNLHDKFLFEMSRDNDNIIFKTIGQ